MGVSYGTSETGFPYVCAVYTCACGRAATQHGRHVDEPPPGWTQVSAEGEGEYLCPECGGKREEES